MKVRDAEELLKGLTNQQRNVGNAGRRRRGASEAASEGSVAVEQGEERIEVSRARDILALLDPQQMQTERAARVAQIKELVASGKYFEQRNSREIAQAVADGLSEEVSAFSSFMEPKGLE